MSRFLSMKDFRDQTAIKKCIAESVEVKMGQIVGHVTSVTAKDTVMKDGSSKVSYAAHGAFEAVNYHTGEAMEAGVIYLPDYFAKELQEALKAHKGNILFGVELTVRPTGQTIPYSWNLRNITGLARSNPLEGLKRLMQKTGALDQRMTPPMDPTVALEITNAVRELSGEVSTVGAAVGEGRVIDQEPEEQAALTHNPDEIEPADAETQEVATTTKSNHKRKAA